MFTRSPLSPSFVDVAHAPQQLPQQRVEAARVEAARGCSEHERGRQVGVLVVGLRQLLLQLYIITARTRSRVARLGGKGVENLAGCAVLNRRASHVDAKREQRAESG